MSDVESDLINQDVSDESQVKDTSGDEVTSPISPDLSDAQLEAVIAHPNFEKLVQKHTNKAYSNLEKRVDDLSQLDRYEKLTKGGLSHEDAKDRIRYQDNMAWVSEQRGGAVVSETPAKPATERASSIDYIAVYETAGVKQPETLKELEWAEQWGDETALKNALLKRRVEEPAEKKPSPGTVVSPGGDKGPEPTDVVGIQAEIDAFLTTREGFLPEGREKLKELRQKLEEAEE